MKTVKTLLSKIRSFFDPRIPLGGKIGIESSFLGMIIIEFHFLELDLAQGIGSIQRNREPVRFVLGTRGVREPHRLRTSPARRENGRFFRSDQIGAVSYVFHFREVRSIVEMPSRYGDLGHILGRWRIIICPRRMGDAEESGACEERDKGDQQLTESTLHVRLLLRSTPIRTRRTEPSPASIPSK